MWVGSGPLYITMWSLSEVAKIRKVDYVLARMQSLKSSFNYCLDKITKQPSLLDSHIVIFSVNKAWQLISLNYFVNFVWRKGLLTSIVMIFRNE